jgi:hypothetical protein
MLEARRIKCTWHVACTGREGSAYKFLQEKPEGNPHQKELFINTRMILKYNFREWEWSV